jgi:formylglycine-generating enzyme required for sulfatase activity
MEIPVRPIDLWGLARKDYGGASGVRRSRKLLLSTAAGLGLALAAVGFFVLHQKARAGNGSDPKPAVTHADSLHARVNPKDGLTYVWIPAGLFQMGCSPGDNKCDSGDEPAKRVTIAKGFWLGESEVPQAAYEKVTGKNPSHFGSYFKGANRPVEQVTWDDAGAYCRAIEGRLPREVEWEYAARAGTKGARYGELDRAAWYQQNSGSSTHPVEQKDPNGWGLYDMLGNVWEWVEDPYPGTEGQARTLRGGSWAEPARNVRSSGRIGVWPSFRDDHVGFRCVLE